MKSRTKNLLLWLHRWFGLIAGLYFVLLGISGSYLVYDEWIDDLRKPELRQSVASSNSFSLSALISSAQKGLATELSPARITIPENPQSNASVTFNIPLGNERRRFVTAYVDPVTNEFKGQELFTETLTGFMFRFHHDLFMGPLGHTIIAVCGVIMMALLLTGLYLWWPKNNNFRKALSWAGMKNFFQLNFELHRLSGLYSLVLMILVTFTGIYLSRPDWFTVSQSKRDAAASTASSTQSAPVVFDFSKIEAVLQQQQMQLRPASLRIDSRSGIVNFQGKDGVNDSSIKIDGRKSEILESSDRANKEGKSLRAINHDLHAGYFWGHLGELLIFVSGILPLFFYITGMCIWLKKPKVKTRAV